MARAHPRNLFRPELLPAPPNGRTIVVGCGKAAAAMAAAFEAAWPHPVEGAVVTQYGHSFPTRFIEVLEANHPVPDAASVDAGRRMMALARSAGADDLVVALIAGGGSALLCLPADGITLADKQEMGRALLRCGAPITEINRVRRAMSAIKGGRLAAAIAPAPCVTYMISDVPGDDPAIIGGGPTVLSPEDAGAALEAIARYHLPADARLEAAIRANPPPASLAGDMTYHMIATPGMALEAAAAEAEARGIRVYNLGDRIEGEAREVAADMARRVRGMAEESGEGPDRPFALISGGETTVTLKGTGRGGRNGEFLLALALALDGAPGIWALACDTDGIDGSEDNAGAVIGPDILVRAEAAGLDARAYLENNDAYGFFAALKALVVTGPTTTNVNDFRAILVT